MQSRQSPAGAALQGGDAGAAGRPTPGTAVQVSSGFQCKTTCVSIVDEQSVLLKTAAPKAFAVVQKHNFIFPRASGLVGWLCLPECRQVLLVDDPAADIRLAPDLMRTVPCLLRRSHPAGMPLPCSGVALSARARAGSATIPCFPSWGWFVGAPLIASNGQRVGGL